MDMNEPPPSDDRARGRALMDEAAAGIVEGVQRLGADWVVAAVRAVAGDERDVEKNARAAGEVATARVVAELQALFAEAPERQRATPLEIVRSLRREATVLLAELGVPPVPRDPYDARAFPDDLYGIVPRSLADLGDDDLGPLLLVWGTGKTMTLRGKPTDVENSGDGLLW